jgi:phosphoserine phosphatase RsbU/P
MHVLIAEDDPVTRLHLTAALKGLGYEVTAAADGKEAWGTLQLGAFAVVISDWQMPEIDGTELCQRLRARTGEQYTYFILITSKAGKPRYLEGMQSGADDFIAKPVDIEELHARLKVAERILGLRKHVQQLEGLLPICSYCKRIRDDQQSWNSLEGYIEKRSEAQFSHGICPDCYKKHVEPQLRG